MTCRGALRSACMLDGLEHKRMDMSVTSPCSYCIAAVVVRVRGLSRNVLDLSFLRASRAQVQVMLDPV